MNIVNPPLSQKAISTFRNTVRNRRLMSMDRHGEPQLIEAGAGHTRVNIIPLAVYSSEKFLPKFLQIDDLPDGKDYMSEEQRRNYNAIHDLEITPIIGIQLNTQSNADEIMDVAFPGPDRNKRSDNDIKEISREEYLQWRNATMVNVEFHEPESLKAALEWLYYHNPQTKSSDIPHPLLNESYFQSPYSYRANNDNEVLLGDLDQSEAKSSSAGKPIRFNKGDNLHDFTKYDYSAAMEIRTGFDLKPRVSKYILSITPEAFREMKKEIMLDNKNNHEEERTR